MEEILEHCGKVLNILLSVAMAGHFKEFLTNCEVTFHNLYLEWCSTFKADFICTLRQTSVVVVNSSALCGSEKDVWVDPL